MPTIGRVVEFPYKHSDLCNCVWCGSLNTAWIQEYFIFVDNIKTKRSLTLYYAYKTRFKRRKAEMDVVL